MTESNIYIAQYTICIYMVHWAKCSYASAHPWDLQACIFLSCKACTSAQGIMNSQHTRPLSHSCSGHCLCHHVIISSHWAKFCLVHPNVWVGHSTRQDCWQATFEPIFRASARCLLQHATHCNLHLRIVDFSILLMWMQCHILVAKSLCYFWRIALALLWHYLVTLLASVADTSSVIAYAHHYPHEQHIVCGTVTGKTG